MTELENLFSAAVPDSDSKAPSGKSNGRHSLGQKSEKVHLIDLRRANNCKIMLTKVKMPLPDLMSSVLALDDSVLDGDQVGDLIKFCPIKEEMDLLKLEDALQEILWPSKKFEQEATKPTEKALRRLAQNQEASRKSRLRKKAYMQQLESQLIKLAQIEQELERARHQVMYIGGYSSLGGWWIICSC